MYIFIGIIFVVLGFTMLVAPKAFYAIVEGWKHQAPSEPTRLFRISTRTGGVMFLIVGVAAIIVPVIT